MKLQSILLPDKDICNEEELYFHRDGKRIVFDGYFNLFYLEKHHKYCDIDDLALVLRCRGIEELRILHDKRVVSSLKLGPSKDNERIDIELPYKDFVEGVLYFEVEVLDEKDWEVQGYFAARCLNIVRTEIAVNICTFRREKYVTRNMDVLKRWLTRKDLDHRIPEVAEHLHFFIIDNGKTLQEQGEFQNILAEIQAGDSIAGIDVIPNANTGGAGGFGRGMQEAIRRREELGLTHLLMMDDDASFDPDMFIRLYGFLSMLKAEYRGITIGGALLREDHQYIQHAAGEWFTNFKVINEHPLLDLRKYDNCTMEYQLSTVREHKLYGAWWCCCYSMDAIKKENLPLPIFVHHDDIQFGLREVKRGIVFLNGIGVWHQGFELVFPGVKQYYNMRNTLITMNMYEPETLRKRLKYWTIRRYIGMLISYRYADCEFIYQGLMDFLKGEKWLLTSDPEAIHINLMSRYTEICHFQRLDDAVEDLYGAVAGRLIDETVNISSRISVKDLRDYYDSDKYKGELIKKLTFNGWILPSKKEIKVITPLNSPWDVYRHRMILLYEPATGKACLMKKDSKELFKGIVRMISMCRAIDGWKRENDCLK